MVHVEPAKFSKRVCEQTAGRLLAARATFAFKNGVVRFPSLLEVRFEYNFVETCYDVIADL